MRAVTRSVFLWLAICVVLLVPWGQGGLPDAKAVPSHFNGEFSLIRVITADGDWPFGVVANRDGTRAYVTNEESGSVSSINLGTGAVTGTVPVGSGPRKPYLTKDGTTLYVPVGGAGRIAVIDTRELAILDEIEVGGSPNFSHADDQETILAVTNTSTGHVELIEMATNSLISSTFVGADLRGVSIARDGQRLFVALGNGSVASYALPSMQRISLRANVGQELSEMVSSADGEHVLVTSRNDNALAVLDVDLQSVKSISVGVWPHGIALSEDGRLAAVPNWVSGSVSVVDLSLEQVIATFESGPGPIDAEFTQNDRRLLVTNREAGTLAVFEVPEYTDARPSAPGRVREGVRSVSSVQVRWDAAAGNGSAVSGYVVGVSRDGGVSWVETGVGLPVAVGVSPPQFRVNVPGLSGVAQAALVRVQAVNARGSGAWSDPVLVTTTGSRSSVRVSVVDAEGVPVIGGAITWRMVSGAASSSRTYGLTDDGVIDFPLAPAGLVDVTVTGALTESGASVSGVFRGTLGFTSTVLRLPEAPVASRVVAVRLPNGLPVPGVTVALDPAEGQYRDADCLEWAVGDLGPADYCLDGQYGAPSLPGGFTFSRVVGAFTFTVPRVAQTVTDANGEVRLTGFSNGQPRVDVSYDDGIISQAKSVVLRNASTVIELDYMPWVEVAAESLTARSGAAVTIPVTVETSSGSSGVARSGAGVKVTVVPPPGAARGTCRDQLTATTNSRGVARVTVCATKSGMYRFKTEGAAAVDGVLIRVRGAAPMAPTSVTVRSLSVGTARATWAAPVFDGGFPVTEYVITATAKGKPTVTETVPATTRNFTLKRLANATTYTVRIQARTARGLSDPVTTTTPIA